VKASRPYDWQMKSMFVALCVLPAIVGAQSRYDVVETSIAQIHDAMRARRLTCRALVEKYLARRDRQSTRWST
jgi:hypothetical protein